MCPGGKLAGRKILDGKMGRTRSRASKLREADIQAKSLFLLLSRKIGAESEPGVDEPMV